MLTEREKALRDLLLREMDGLAHVDRSRIEQGLDPAEVERALADLRRTRKLRTVFLWIGVAYLAALAVVMGLKIHRYTPPFLLIAGMVWLVIYVRQSARIDRLSVIFRALQVIQTGEETPDAQPAPPSARD